MISHKIALGGAIFSFAGNLGIHAPLEFFIIKGHLLLSQEWQKVNKETSTDMFVYNNKYNMLI